MPNKAPSSSPAQKQQQHQQAQPPPQTFTDGLPLPKLVVFDLDYTLWPFWIDTHVAPPLRPLPAGHASAGRAVKDARGASFGFYKDVPGVLRACREKGLLVGAASRTYTPDLAKDLLGLLDIPDGSSGGSSNNKKADAFFDALQIFPGNKVSHMTKLSKQLGVGYEEMLFFDDEERNRNVERELGVCFWLVRDGVTREEMDRGVGKWRKQRGVGGGAAKRAQDGRGSVDVSLVDDSE